MQSIYLINLIYESGKEQLLLDEEYMHLQSLKAVREFAARRVKKLNSDFVASIVGKVARYEIWEAKKLRDSNPQRRENGWVKHNGIRCGGDRA